MLYNRLNPLHWIVALFSNSRKSDYLKEGTFHVDFTEVKATQRIKYWFRNPAHDFMHHIVGFQNEPEFRTVYGDAENTLKPGLILALRRYKYLFLPYIAYQGWFQFYLGWRPTGGFGIKLRPTPKA